MHKIIEFFESIPMIIISGLFVAASLILSIFDINPVINPAWGAIIISGLPLIYSAGRKLLFNKGLKRISSALLISIAMIAAIVIKEVFAAGEVAFIMAIGELLEELTTGRARRGINKLIELSPVTARRITACDEEVIDAKQIAVDDILRVLPGEKIPADGVIIKGSTSVDQSVITGESLPVDKEEGDDIYCGTINRFGSFDMKVTQTGENSSLGRLIFLVEEARKNKAPMHRTADKWASILVPVALLLAIIAGSVKGNVQVAVTVLVVFCPCALVLATPTAIIAAIGQATKRGILIKSGEALEKMAKVDTVAFDKTGTLTYGNLCVSDVLVFGNNSEEELMKIAVGCEMLSEHPLGKAVVSCAKKKYNIVYEPVDAFNMQTGKGVSGRLNGKICLCGNEKLLADYGLQLSENQFSHVNRFRQEGKATVIVVCDNEILGVISLADTIRENTPAIIKKTGEMGIDSVLLTGDSENAGRYIAGNAGIEEVYSGLLPENKSETVYRMQCEGKTICMIGDGVNDAPALKSSDVGIAMATVGSDITIDAADIAFMNDDINNLPYLIRLSRAMVRTIKISIAISLIINFVAIILSFFEILNPVLGALVHNAGSVFVILFAALLYDRKF